MVSGAENSDRSLDGLEDDPMLLINGIRSSTGQRLVHNKDEKYLQHYKPLLLKQNNPLTLGVSPSALESSIQNRINRHLFVPSSKKFLSPKALGNEMHN